MAKYELQTPGPWSVRVRRNRSGNPDTAGEIVDCFVTAQDVNGYAYDAEVLGDDEYHEQSGGIARKLADCTLIAAAPELRASLRRVLDAFECAVGNAWPEFAGTRASEPDVYNAAVRDALQTLAALDRQLAAPHNPLAELPGAAQEWPYTRRRP